MKIVELERTCWGFPSQWEGKLEDGRPVYIRFRHGQLVLSPGKIGGDIWTAVGAPSLVDFQLGDPHSGLMTEEMLQKALGERWHLPKAIKGAMTEKDVDEAFGQARGNLSKLLGVIQPPESEKPKQDPPEDAVTVTDDKARIVSLKAEGKEVMTSEEFKDKMESESKGDNS